MPIVVMVMREEAGRLLIAAHTLARSAEPSQQPEHFLAKMGYARRVTRGVRAMVVSVVSIPSILAILSILATAGCARDLKGAVCPCLDGWVCCDNTCRMGSQCAGAPDSGDDANASGHPDAGEADAPDGAAGGPLAITPMSATVSVKRRLRLSANRPVTWSVVEGRSGGSIDGTGLYTSPAGVGNFHVMAAGDDGATAVATLNVVPLRLELVAGQLEGSGNLDGDGTRAYFNSPSHLAFNSGRLTVTEDNSPSTFRSIDLRSGAKVRTFGVLSYKDGRFGVLARMFPDRFLVADGSSIAAIYDGPGNTVLLDRAGSAQMPGFADGPFETARFSSVWDVAWDPTASLAYVLDGHAIRKLDFGARTVTTIAGASAVFPSSCAACAGYADGVGTDARFDFPFDAAIDPQGRTLYVADSGNFCVRAMNLDTLEVTTLAGSPGNTASADGAGPSAGFIGPRSIAWDGAGHLVVIDSNGVGPYAIRKIDVTTREVTTLLEEPLLNDNQQGCWARDGAAGVALLGPPPRNASLEVDGAGHAFAADYWNNAIREIDLETGQVSTIAGAIDYGPSRCNPGSDRWQRPIDLVALDATSVAVIDEPSANPGAVHRIRRVDLAMRTASILWSAPGGDFWNGLARTAGGSLVLMFGVSLEPSELLLVDPGSGEASPLFDPGGQHSLSLPAQFSGMATDGDVLLLAGQTGILDVPLTSSQGGLTGALGSSFIDPARGFVAVAAGKGGTRFAASFAAVYQIAPGAQDASLLAGDSPGFADAIGSSARFGSVNALAFDAQGSLFVADGGNGAIRAIDLASGAVTTEVGIPGIHGVTPGELPASLNAPRGIAVLDNGDLVIADENALLWLH
jgi:hypothetical protein